MDIRKFFRPPENKKPKEDFSQKSPAVSPPGLKREGSKIPRLTEEEFEHTLQRKRSRGEGDDWKERKKLKENTSGEANRSAENSPPFGKEVNPEAFFTSKKSPSSAGKEKPLVKREMPQSPASKKSPPSHSRSLKDARSGSYDDMFADDKTLEEVLRKSEQEFRERQVRENQEPKKRPLKFDEDDEAELELERERERERSAPKVKVSAVKEEPIVKNEDKVNLEKERERERKAERERKEWEEMERKEREEMERKEKETKEREKKEREREKKEREAKEKEKQKAQEEPQEIKSSPKKAQPSTPKGKKKKDEPEEPVDEEQKKLEEEEKRKKKATNFQNFLARERRKEKPLNPGTKDIPEGEPYCLAGLKFVFTGDLDSLSREGATDLVRRYGGEIAGSVSKKTSYVVVGADPGATKMTKVTQLGIRTLDEDQFFDMIRTRPGQEDKKPKAVVEYRQAHGITTPAKDQHPPPTPKSPQVSPPPISALSAISPVSSSPIVPHGSITSPHFSEKSIATLTRQLSNKGKGKEVVPERKNVPLKTSQLWTDKYKPDKIEDIVGNKSFVNRVLIWLQRWHLAYQSEFKGPAKNDKKDEDFTFRALLLSGPPGIGKTTTVNLAAKAAGYEVIEFNASDTRSKKSLEQEVSTMIGNHGISEFFKPEFSANKKPQKVVLVMEEIDGMSGSDRGGVAELIKLIQNTKIPIICVCNDSSTPKLRSLLKYVSHIKFARPDIRAVREKMMLIAEKEGLVIDSNAMDQLIMGSNNDIRQILTVMSSYRLGADFLDFDHAKHLMSRAGKNIEMGPFEAIAKLLGGRHQAIDIDAMMELYFIDYSLMPLMVQENYIRCRPHFAQNEKDPKLRELQELQYLSRAAESISDGDLCNAIVHEDQEWGLLPVQGLLSTLIPTYYSHGIIQRSHPGSGYDFAGWLGKNSSQQKFQRIMQQIHLHANLRISADKNEFRQTYLPVFKKRLAKPMVDLGVNGIDEVIEMMDYYYLNREDLDNINELTHQFNKKEPELFSQIPSQVKSQFTRRFNQMNHAVPYIEASTIIKGKGKAAKPSLDGEELEGGAYQEEEENEGEGEDEEKIENDKMIKMKKEKASGSGSSKASKGKKTDAPSSSRSKGKK